MRSNKRAGISEVPLHIRRTRQWHIALAHLSHCLREYEQVRARARLRPPLDVSSAMENPVHLGRLIRQLRNDLTEFDEAIAQVERIKCHLERKSA